MKRVIPVLLIMDGGLVKSVRFKSHRYVGDPINAVKIFNEKEVDEIIILDISATKDNLTPNIERISEIASEAFMPLSYGGGITTIDQVKKILYQGVEKVIFNSSAIFNENLISETANRFGSSSTVVSIDYKKNFWGKNRVYTNCGKRDTGLDVVAFAKKMSMLGAGEIFLNSIDKDGTYSGYDLPLIQKVSDAVDIPVIACGGAANDVDLASAVNEGHASASAAGSMFVFQGVHKAVLISYPNWDNMQKMFKK